MRRFFRRCARCVPDRLPVMPLRARLGFRFSSPAARSPSASAISRCRSSVECPGGAARVLLWPIRAISSRRFAPAVAVGLFPVWRKSWKCTTGNPAFLSAGSQVRRRKFPRRSSAPVGPVKTRPSSSGRAKRDRCSRTTGAISWGKPTVRRPASDLGGPNASAPFWSSMRERWTRTVRASTSMPDLRSAHSSPHRRLVKVASSTSARYRRAMRRRARRPRRRSALPALVTTRFPRS